MPKQTEDEIPPTFRQDDARACDVLARKRDDLARARKLSPVLVPSLEAEITTCEQALERARQAAIDHERERVAALRATAERQRAVTELNSSLEVDPAEASRIVHAAECGRYLEAAYKRRADAAHSAASGSYFRAAKDISERNAAVNFAERLAGAVIDREQDRVQAETRPAVLAWLPLTLAVEGRAAYERGVENRAGNRSFPEPPPIEEYDAACRSVFGQIRHLREQAAAQAAELAAFA